MHSQPWLKFSDLPCEQELQFRTCATVTTLHVAGGTKADLIIPLGQTTFHIVSLPQQNPKLPGLQPGQYGRSQNGHVRWLSYPMPVYPMGCLLEPR